MARRQTERSRGALVAALLAGAWRATPPPPTVSEAELSEVVSLLLDSGGGALGWWRLYHSELRSVPAASLLRQAYRLHTLEAAIHESNIKEALTLFSAAGVTPLLIKGWAIARLYPEPGLRPYGDIDLCVRPEHYRRAQEVLKSVGFKYPVDLHKGVIQHEGHSFAELFERSLLVQLDDVDVRILRAEDHLRTLCLHLLRHGAMRPLWLCDIALALESRVADFDWNLCLGRSRRRADWIACAIGLAHELLGVAVEDTPVQRRVEHLPTWLLPTALKEWGRLLAYRTCGTGQPMTSYLTRPRGLLHALRSRWPNPITATISVESSFNELPRLPFQLGNCFLRTAQFLMHRSE
jgi:hypothetical protein